MFRLFHLPVLRLLIILLVATHYLRVTSSYALNTPKVLKPSLIAQKTDLNSPQKQAVPESCSYQPPPLSSHTPSIALLTLQLENQTVVIEVRGSSVFNQKKLLKNDDIQKIIATYQEKTLSKEEFSQLYFNLANLITQLYLNEGYITSKANPQNPLTITDQGVAVIPVLEGRLSQIQLLGRERLNLSYLCSRIALGVGLPVNIIQLEKN